ncbi:hypothetical protein ACWGH3_28545 [Streptomyces sp. NPDC054884]|uniref:hypothetical protein n=1 Tax=Streptomyces sp. ME08-AFT2 TaxID=3028683 RepID=UPI0029A3AA1F|nr:hypothetical protein [Streptomyces sp. ME08-AFT2]MDX3311267.1 hypothetical protein [Streptomyces sp. ME08-AFT2]
MRHKKDDASLVARYARDHIHGTAGLALTVALLPGTAGAAPDGPADRPRPGAGSPAAGGVPPVLSQQTLARRDARVTPAEQRPGVRRLRDRLGPQGVLELDPATGTARQVAELDGVDCAQDDGPSGCQYLDATELVVFGTTHQG